jgi:hypothetical protein
MHTTKTLPRTHPTVIAELPIHSTAKVRLQLEATRRSNNINNTHHKAKATPHKVRVIHPRARATHNRATSNNNRTVRARLL